jgi:thioredoxin-dependent peroxiredoxin
MLKPGETAPDFAVADETLYGILKVRRAVLYFFPKAFTPGCTRESLEFRREFERLWAAGYAVIGISTDDQGTSDRFRASLDLPFPLVGDAVGEICRSYRVRWPIVGFAQRVTYVIDRDGRIELARHDELRAGRHAHDVCRTVLEDGDGKRPPRVS